MKQASIAIIGAGESGVGAALLAQKTGAALWLSDAGKIKPAFVQQLIENNVPFEEGGHTIKKFFEADIIIKSPGVPEKAALVVELRKRGARIISEIEYAWMHSDAEIVAVTGSNGKTTTASLIHHLLQNAGMEVALGGNIGHSFARLVVESPAPRYVLEVSSFQLDDIVDFRPDVAVLTNITPDHLDRYHHDFARYREAKFRIGMNQQAADVFIYCQDDPVIAQNMSQRHILAEKWGFGWEQRAGGQAWIEVGAIHLDEGPAFPLDLLQIRGRHNALNAMAAVLAAHRMGLGADAIATGLQTFSPITHRLEPVETTDGITWINDSKATNVDAAAYALESIHGPTIWIAGGIDKGNEYDALDVSRVKALIILGLHTDKLHQAFDDKIHRITEAKDMKEAIHQARAMAQQGDTVLLSPACASFDLFENYEDRGRQFKWEIDNTL